MLPYDDVKHLVTGQEAIRWYKIENGELVRNEDNPYWKQYLYSENRAAAFPTAIKPFTDGNILLIEVYKDKLVVSIDESYRQDYQQLLNFSKFNAESLNIAGSAYLSIYISESKNPNNLVDVLEVPIEELANSECVVVPKVIDLDANEMYCIQNVQVGMKIYD